MDNSTKYEVLDEKTGLWTPVTAVTIGEEEVFFTLEGGEEVRFKNTGSVGNLKNSTHAVRIIETEGQADGTGFVTDEGVETEVAPTVEESI